MIIKSKYDSKLYKNITLDNGLQVILISNPTSEISYASMVVNVGYLYDTTPGIAHFLEHMLFMGSKKYEQENYYQTYLSEHGGSSNAYTATDHTCYYFNILNNYFEKMLDIFGNFFIEPLLNDGSVNREMKAVDSEHKKNMVSEPWRLLDVVRDIITKNNPGHPMGKFGTGCLETLNVPNITKILRDFYDSHYHANNYKLVIMHNDTLENMEIFVSKIFENIRVKSYVSNLVISMPFLKSFKIKIIPIKNINDVILSWQMPRDTLNYTFKPLNYLIYIMSNMSNGTPIYFLKQYGYVNNISIELMEEAGNMCLFSVIMNLTRKGFKYKNQIIDVIFALLEKIKKYGITEQMYNERNNILFNNFNYSEQTDLTKFIIDVSVNMLSYNPIYCVAIDILNEPYNTNIKNIITEYIEKYMNYDSTNIYYISKNYKNDKNIIKSEWMNVEYIYERDKSAETSPVIVAYVNHYLEKKELFPANRFITVSNTIATLPKNIIKNDIINIGNNGYYLYDSSYKKPLTYVGLVIENDKINNNICNFMNSLIYIKILKRIIEIDLYDAYILGYFIKLNISNNHVTLYIGSHTSVIYELLNICINMINNPNYERFKQYFKQIKNGYKKVLKNYKYSQPYQHTLDELSNHYSLKSYKVKDQLKKINSVTLQSLKKHFIFKNINLKYLIYGNNDSIDKLTLLLDSFKSDEQKTISKNNFKPKELLFKNLYKDERNSAIVLSYYLGEINYDDKNTKTFENNYFIFCMAKLISSYMQEPFFDNLRTRQQLGYIVKSKISEYGYSKNPIVTFDFFIQSPNYTSKELQKRILEFINHFELNKEKFKSYIENCKTEIIKKSETMIEEFIYYFTKIQNNSYLFNFKQIIYDTYTKITYEMFEEFFNDKIKNNPICTVIGSWRS